MPRLTDKPNRPTCSGEDGGLHYHDLVSMISNGAKQWKCPISSCGRTAQKNPKRKGKKRLEELREMGKLIDRPSCINQNCERFGIPMHKNLTHYRCPIKGCGCSVKIKVDG